MNPEIPYRNMMNNPIKFENVSTTDHVIIISKENNNFERQDRLSLANLFNS